MTNELLAMTKKLFGILEVYYDEVARSAAMNMAIDEALLEYATKPIIRFYRWQSPALSFGYFGRFADVAGYERDLVRRWTGGGVVLHGEDLTYSIVIPVGDSAFAESSISIYEKIHLGLVAALCRISVRAQLVESARCADRTPQRDVPTDNCFANPVRADVMIDGRKVAGAAQRRTCRGLLQQGSIQGIELGNDLTEQFAQVLSTSCRERIADEETLNLARELSQQKYGTEGWLRKR
jgi:lipoyl(octanoyl) transferase